MKNKDLVSQIKILGNMKGETLKEIGEKSGVGKNSIFRWNKTEPRISSIKKVAKYLDVDYKILLP